MKDDTFVYIAVILIILLFISSSEKARGSDIYRIYEKVEPVELVDGNYLAIVTDGFQLYLQDPVSGLSEVEMKDPDELAYRVKQMAYQYDWLYKKYYQCQNEYERKHIESTCEDLGL